MAQQLIAGTFQGKAVKGTAKIGRKGNGQTLLGFVELEIVDGEHKGKRFTFEGKLDDKAIKYTKRNLIAIGWKGQTSKTLTVDVDAALEAGLVVPFDVEIATWNKPDGSVRQWSAVRSIGNFAPAIAEANADDLAKVDSWFGEVSADNSDVPF